MLEGIKSSKGRLGKMVIDTPPDLLPGNISERLNQILKSTVFGCRYGSKRYRKEAMRDNSQPKADNFAMAMDNSKVIQNSSATFKRGDNSPISLQPMLGTWIVFELDMT
jgi:hypothetical protein